MHKGEPGYPMIQPEQRCCGLGACTCQPAHDPDDNRPTIHAAIRQGVEQAIREEMAQREADFEAEFRRWVDRYLDTLHAAMWGRAFDIVHNRDKAVDFIVNTYKSIAAASLDVESK